MFFMPYRILILGTMGKSHIFSRIFANPQLRNKFRKIRPMWRITHESGSFWVEARRIQFDAIAKMHSAFFSPIIFASTKKNQITYRCDSAYTYELSPAQLWIRKKKNKKNFVFFPYLRPRIIYEALDKFIVLTYESTRSHMQS